MGRWESAREVRVCVRRPLAIGLAVCAFASGCAGLGVGLGGVSGEVRIGSAGAPSRLGPAVVYLEREQGAESRTEGTVTLADTAGHGPGHDLVVVTRGQALRFASESGVAHRLFALRESERIEVRVPEAGESSEVPMQRVGWLRFYCSLHEDESWDVFVAPSSHYARLDPAGSYHIVNVPPGDYRLSIWSGAVKGEVRQVRVGLLGTQDEPISLDPAKIRP